MGGSSVVTRDVAHRYPDAIFVSTFWDEQEVTLRRPAANLFRFTPDYAQQEAGLGAYAYHVLGWRRASIVAGDGNPGWAGAAAFTAEFCSLGGTVVATAYAGSGDESEAVARALAARPDGVATFLTAFDEPGPDPRPLAAKLDSPRRLLLWGQSFLDPHAAGKARRAPRRRRLRRRGSRRRRRARRCATSAGVGVQPFPVFPARSATTRS